MSALEYKNAGNKAFTDGRFDEAVTAFSKAIELEDNYVFFSNRSGAYASMKRFQDALNDADACVKRAPQWAKGYSRRGGALFGLGRLEDAKAAYEEGLKLEPSNQACKDGIAEVNAKAAAASRPRPAGPGGAGVGLGSLFGPDMFTKLRANPKTAKYMQEPDFVQMMTLLQSNPQAMGSLMQQDKRLQVALGVLIGVDFSSMPRAPGQADDDDVFGRGGDEDDEEEPVSANRAHPSMARAGPAAPAGAAAGAASSSSSSSSSSSKMSDDAAGAAAAPQAEEEGQEVDEELEAEKRERAATRAKADAEKDLGTVAYKKRDFATAASHYLKAAEIDPSNPIYLANLSIVRNEEGDFKSCVDACKDALAAGKMEPVTKARLLVRMGNALGKLNRWGEAIEAFKHAILEDNAPATRTLLKAAEVSKKKADEEAYLDPVKSEAAKEEGNELFREGKFADAIDKYTEALKRDPSNYKVYSNRAACYTKLMQWDKGLDDCAKVRSIVRTEHNSIACCYLCPEILQLIY